MVTINNALAFVLKNKKKLIIIAAVFILFAAGFSFLLAKPENETVYTVTRENLVNTVLINGTYTTAAQTQVVSPAKGIIKEIYIENNDRVENGSPLFFVESTATDEEKAAAVSDYQNAVSNLKIARQAKESADALMWTKQVALLDARNTKKYKDEHSQNPSTGKDYTELEKQSIDTEAVLTEKDFKAAEKKYLEADSVISAAAAALTKASLAYAATQSIIVKAPASGEVVNFSKKIGDQVVTDATSPVLVIADFANPSITSQVNEVNIPRLARGQKAAIVFDSLPDETFDGIVESIDSVGTKIQGAITYTVKISASSLPSTVKPQMTASITIETGRKNGILTVPNSALIKKDRKTYVQRTGNNKNALTEVSLGMKGLSKTEIISGLREGDKVINQE